MAARRVQTNEVRRCACLLPAFGLASAQAGGRRLALVEIGRAPGRTCSGIAAAGPTLKKARPLLCGFTGLARGSPAP